MDEKKKEKKKELDNVIIVVGEYGTVDVYVKEEKNFPHNVMVTR
jgi:hypothetical protein